MNQRGLTAARITVTVFGAIHLVIVIWHGTAHRELAVSLSPAQNLFVYVVIVFTPLLALGLLWTRYVNVALWLFLIAMCASLVFGAYYHYVFDSLDNIHDLPPGSDAAHARFVISAAILALTQLEAALCAAFVLGWYHASKRRK